MTLITDAVSLLVAAVRAMSVLAPREFGVSLGICVLVAAVSWWSAAYTPVLWKRYAPLGGVLHALCALAAVVTVTLGIAIAALGFAKGVASERIMAWRTVISKDLKVQNDAAAKVYRAVRESGLETFGPEHTPGPNGSANYPVTRPETRRLTSRTYVEAAIEDFAATHPGLHRAIWRGAATPYDRVLEDRQSWDATRLYPVNRYFEVAAQEVLEQLRLHGDRAVYALRRALAALILCAQGIAWGAVLIGSAGRR
ncbi:hypothetical protein F183_A01730 [Bryobacterales bacterium F-183]|nr:hypothetical protein F183_A01730 [Bryobacterales bacterium F-183]